MSTSRQLPLMERLWEGVIEMVCIGGAFLALGAAVLWIIAVFIYG